MLNGTVGNALQLAQVEYWGDAIVLWHDGPRILTFPLRQLRVIKHNLNRGVRWDIASPMYPIDREDAAAILNVNWDVLTKH